MTIHEKIKILWCLKNAVEGKLKYIDQLWQLKSLSSNENTKINVVLI